MMKTMKYGHQNRNIKGTKWMAQKQKLTYILNLMCGKETSKINRGKVVWIKE